ncbi:M6 family metalloprotease domain-containing protein, partial [Streptomyces tanashiensis]
GVSCGKDLVKETKETKEAFKEGKDRKDLRDGKPPRKEIKDDFDHPPSVTSRSAGGEADPTVAAILDLQTRLAALERDMGGADTTEPFIGSELRPDLEGGPRYGPGTEALREAVEAGDAQAKRAYDCLPRP